MKKDVFTNFAICTENTCVGVFSDETGELTWSLKLVFPLKQYADPKELRKRSEEEAATGGVL